MAKAKLRKMMGDMNGPAARRLMEGIETQSKATLARWAAGEAEGRYLPLFAAAHPEEPRLRELVEGVKAHLAGQLPLVQLKAQIKEARTIPQALEAEPLAQAAARAVVTACAVLSTPTNALGFTFYGAAAAAYRDLGLEKDQEAYDLRAEAEMTALADSLEQVLIPGEPKPVKVKWTC